MAIRVLILAALALSASATVYFKEDFADDGWSSRWVQSKHSGKEIGEFTWTAGKFFGDAEKDKGKCCELSSILGPHLVCSLARRVSILIHLG